MTVKNDKKTDYNKTRDSKKTAEIDKTPGPPGQLSNKIEKTTVTRKDKVKKKRF